MTVLFYSVVWFLGVELVRFNVLLRPRWDILESSRRVYCVCLCVFIESYEELIVM